MNDNNRRRLEAGQRCRQWIVDNAGLIPAASLFETKTTALTDVVDDLEDLSGEIESAVGEGLSATDVKGSVREDLMDIMEKVRRAARAAEPDVPGTQDRYRFTRNLSNELLLARGRSFAEGGATDEALLISYGAPTNWPDLVSDASDAFEASFGPQASAVGDRVGKNAVINEKIELFMQLKRTISLMVPNVCVGNTAAIASWNSAAHVEEAPKKKKKDEGGAEDPPTP
ncbi:MAG: hypothetical protein WBO10_02340 [Pyrinomonadaceae bacterium]